MARHSGYTLGGNDIPTVLGMAARGDRNHDIAAWFGVNQGRIKEAKDGRYGSPPAAPSNQLPPSGAPGMKGRRLRSAADVAIAALSNSQVANAQARSDALKALKAAAAAYDKNEP